LEVIVTVFDGDSRGKKGGPDKAAVSQPPEHQDEVEYREALERLANEAKLPVEEFEQTILVGLGSTSFGPDCIRLDEVERWALSDRLPVERRQHVDRCTECQQFLAAIQPLDEEVDHFAKCAAKPS
jgi:hypothetical protein